MSTFNRFVHVPGRRAYSYFSSRSGGNRYFNSAKPPKPAVVAPKGAPATTTTTTTTTTTSSTSPKVDPSAEGKQDGVKGASSASHVSTSESTLSRPEQKPSTSSVGSEKSSTDSASGNQSGSSVNPFETFRSHIPAQYLSAKDFKMHQFFSLHRPLLLVSQPSSLFRNLPPNHPLFNSLPLSEADTNKRVMQSISGLVDTGFQSPGEASFIDADAEAARQLTRALTMSKAGAIASWEETLKMLGLDLSKGAERVNLEQQFEKDWEHVMMDSTRRKRRKKMKKHKLKKRRRATRSERLRLK